MNLAMNLLKLASTTLVAFAADEQSPRELEWKLKLSPLSKLMGEDLHRQTENLGIYVIDVQAEAKKNEEEAHEFYSDYFKFFKEREKRLKISTYSGQYLEPHKKLPADFKDRPLSDQAILIVDQETTRESYFHLLLHHLAQSPEQKRLAENSQKIRRQLMDLKKSKADKNDKIKLETELADLELDLFLLDTEVEKDLFLIEQATEFLLTDKDLSIIKARAQRNFGRKQSESNSLTQSTLGSQDLKIEVQKRMQELEERTKRVIELPKPEEPKP